MTGRRTSLWQRVAVTLAVLLVASLAWREWRAAPAPFRPSSPAAAAPVIEAPRVRAVAPVDAAAAPRDAPELAKFLASPAQVASRREADAALLALSQQDEEALIRGDTLDTPRIQRTLSSDEFFALDDGFAMQSRQDPAKAEIARLLGDQVRRGFRRLRSEARLERLHCGLRLCTARVLAPSADAEIDLPFPAARLSRPHPQGGSDIRIVFALDPAIEGLHRQAPLQ